jgi:hypothetical protein
MNGMHGTSPKQPYFQSTPLFDPLTPLLSLLLAGFHEALSFVKGGLTHQHFEQKDLGQGMPGILLGFFRFCFV